MIVDKIGQELKTGDFVACAATSYSGGAPTIVVGTIENITSKGNVTLKELYLKTGKWATRLSPFMYPDRRIVKLTGAQLDAINSMLDEAHATKVA